MPVLLCVRSGNSKKLNRIYHPIEKPKKYYEMSNPVHNSSNWERTILGEKMNYSTHYPEINFIEAIPLCYNISFLYVPSYTTIYIKIT